MTIEYSGQQLASADLVIDAVYRGQRSERGGMVDPLVPLVGVSRQGGFRYRGTKENPHLLVLTSNLCEPDWPDELDETTGLFIYYGDNRTPGRQLHDTPRFGNLLLKQIFEFAHKESRQHIPPIFIFTTEGTNRSYRFRGLAVPGHASIPTNEELIAIWKTIAGQRFQNYRACFTILNEAVIKRDWITSIIREKTAEPPTEWRNWLNTGVPSPLIAPKTQLIRSKSEQLPKSDVEKALLSVIYSYHKDDPFKFEACAGAITKLLLRDVSSLILTRPWRDGGRDGVGKLRLGKGAASIEIAFALEAKCYAQSSGVGVREVSRLISRIKHREFGVLVTTSFLDKQAYSEIVEDGHPVIIVSGQDIVNLLRSYGYDTPNRVQEWLDALSLSHESS